MSQTRPDLGTGPQAKHTTLPPTASRSRIARGSTSPSVDESSPTAGLWRESWTKRWLRRSVTIPGLFLLCGIYLALLPMFLVVSVILDVVRRRPFPLVRFHLLVASVLVWHICGMAMMWWVWFRAGRWFGRMPKNFREMNTRAETIWSRQMLRFTEWYYGLSMTVEDANLSVPGPVLLLCRHSSVLDTLLPAFVLGPPHAVSMRIVKKYELIWDPCVDIIAGRLPRAFVKRGGYHGDLSALSHMIQGISGNEAVLVFPEGTRFTPEKQAQVLARLKQKDSEVYERARKLRNVLPPRPGGALRVLEECPEMDVLFCAHTGLEGMNLLKDFMGGALMGRTLKVKFWRIPAAAVPASRDGKMQWLHHHWEKVDQWISQNRDN